MDTSSVTDVAGSEDTTPFQYRTDGTFADHQTAVMLWKVWTPVILPLGTFGNMATIFVMSRIKDRHSSQHAILIALAVSDLLLLYFGALCEAVRYIFRVDLWTMHLAVCKCRMWMVYSTNTTSAWLVTCVTVQRTMAVLWPHRMRGMCTVRRTWVVIVTLGVMACSLQLHLLPGMALSREERCEPAQGLYHTFFINIFTWMDMCLSSLLPSISLLVCSFVLSYTLFKTTSSSSMTTRGIFTVSAMSRRSERRKTASRTTVMVLTLSCTFLLLTMPVCAVLVWYYSCFDRLSRDPQLSARAEFLLTVTYLPWYTNSAINFLLYCLTGTKFRQQFLKWVCCGRQSCV